MKRCQTCNKTFTDPNLSFCIDDGTPLVDTTASADETTVVSPSSVSGPPPTEVYKPRDWQAPDYQPPGFQNSTYAPTKRKTWPWVVGIFAALLIGIIGIGIAGAIFIPKLVRRTSNQNNSNLRAERPGNVNSNLNSSAPVPPASSESPDIAVEDDDAIPPPTDKDVVLADLTNIEHEWTVANVNADKKKLDRILGDDYVGISGDGRTQGKAEYLRTIERDTTIQKWEFEDLKVALLGDRATLEGVIRLQLPDQETSYKFKDKFVWRDGRWQAVGSEVTRIE